MASSIIKTFFGQQYNFSLSCVVTDLDECAAEPEPCSEDATCIDTDGSFECVCNPGFTGDGVQCEGKWRKQCSMNNETKCFI